MFVLRQLTSVLTRNDWRNDRDSISRSKELENRADQSAKCESVTGTWGRGGGRVTSEPLIGTANPLSAHSARSSYWKKRYAKLQARNSFYSKNALEGRQFGKPQMINA